MSNGFPKQVRLLSSGEFNQVFKRVTARAGDRHMTVLACEGQGGQARIGLIVSKKSARRAVARNRVKRLVRESFRHRQAKLPAWDIVFIAKPGIEQIDNQALRQRLDTLWQRLVKHQAKHSDASSGAPSPGR